MKTFEEYMNDPRILNDHDMADAMMPVKEIHAARLRLQDETASMSPAERNEFINAKARKFLVSIGVTPHLVNMSGEGRLMPSENNNAV
ncbi:hypothetical protein FACS1894200_05020 [Spirochaetia bacterium]|nr:hypothetical protein FACS1894200_05020 [Spirochaetia bacterium]